MPNTYDCETIGKIFGIDSRKATSRMSRLRGVITLMVEAKLAQTRRRAPRPDNLSNHIRSALLDAVRLHAHDPEQMDAWITEEVEDLVGGNGAPRCE